MVNHGTYHTCVYTPFTELYGSSAEEFDCGMPVPHSVNLMRVGQESMLGALAMDTASHGLTGFIPPTDAYDDAAEEAMQAVGYSWVSSAWYAEPAGREDFAYTDEAGLVHVPWSQIACGNGAASWTNCQAGLTQGVAAHSGTDCDDPDVCTPAADGKDYTDWDAFAATSLADRCRNDFDRYGACTVLFELTSYDGDFSTGTLDPHAFAGYQQTLTELQQLADQTGAVFMTLGDYAASLQADDVTPPTVEIVVDPEYAHTDSLIVDVSATDAISGVWSTGITLDGAPVEDGDVIDLLDLELGDHVLTATATDRAGNATTASETFAVVATFDSLQALVERYADEGTISNGGVVRSLLKQLDAAERAYLRGEIDSALSTLESFADHVAAQSGKHISSAAADALLTDSEAVMASIE